MREVGRRGGIKGAATLNARLTPKQRHEASVALHFMHYNFARVHQTLRVTPAMEAGTSDHIRTFAEIVALAEKQCTRLAS
jgi:hypothetical protein